MDPDESQSNRVFQWLAGNPLLAGMGAWIATVLLPGFHLYGPIGQQLLAILLVIGVAALGGLGLRVINRAQRRDPVRFRYFEESSAGRAIHAAAMVLALSMRFTPAGVWVSVWLCGMVGLPLRLDGAWATILAWLMIMSVASTSLDEIAYKGANVVGLWLSTVMFDGVQVESGPWEQQILALIMYGWMFGLTLRLNVVLAVGFKGLALWLLPLLDTDVAITVQVSDFWTLLLTLLVITIVSLPFSLISIILWARRADI